MNNIEMDETVLRKFHNNFSDIFSVDLDTIDKILNCYNKGQISINGVVYFDELDPKTAVCLNEKYKKHTGHDHPVFLSEHIKVLDKFIKRKDELSINGKPSIYKRLKNNITKKGPGVLVVAYKKDSYLDRFEKIKYNIMNASLEDVDYVLNYYGQDSEFIDGVEYISALTQAEAMSLNARYKQLSGKDHPNFLAVQKQIANKKFQFKDLFKSREPDYSDLLVADKNHVINRTNDILLNPDEASLEDISALLDIFNGKPIIIDGILYHPFNDPSSGAKLNAKYRELTGNNHRVFMEQIYKMLREYSKIRKPNELDTQIIDSLKQIVSEIETENIQNKR